MVTTSKTKGNRNQLKCIRKLESGGWLVDKVEKTGKFVKIKDLYGLFDIIAIKKDYTKFIQVTTNKVHIHSDYKKFAVKYCGHHLLVEQWVWFDRKGWKKFRYYANGHKRTFDERK